MDRRDFISTVGGLGLVAALGGAAPARRGTVRDENEKPGTTDWSLANTRVDPKSKYRCPWIEGYCSRTSVRPGETIEFKASTNPPSKFTIELYRMGYYGGKGGRLVGRFGPFQGSPQAEPPVGEARLRECTWETCMRLTVEPGWPSGVYLAKLTEQREKLQSYMIFIVRDDRECDFLFQCSDTTWAAYNRWPDLWSLYDDGTPPHNWYTGPGVAVSFDRPYGRYRQIFDAPLSQGSGEFLLWEFPLAFWMERHGYYV
ncbi:MAG: twin-arginine translocation signal domain-containing protein [Pirellulales bacterium]